MHVDQVPDWKDNSRVKPLILRESILRLLNLFVSRIMKKRVEEIRKNLCILLQINIMETEIPS